MIEVQGLSYTYPSSKRIAFPDFALTQGQSCLLLGESGSGKTTLLHLLGGLLKSQEGSIVIQDKEITALSATALDHFRGQHAGFIFQKNHLISALTVEKNLAMPFFLNGLSPDADRIENVLSTLGIADKKKTNIHELSQGQAQRVAIARAVINRPAVVFADEPTAALDDTNCNRVIKLLLDVTLQHQSTLIIATHDHRLTASIQKQVILQRV